MNDEAVANLRSKMILAAERDVEDNQDGKPAIHKLKMLPRVVDLMQKSVYAHNLLLARRSLTFYLIFIRTALAETIVEGGLLEAVKRWLEPLRDKSLPALNIQRPIFNILRTVGLLGSILLLKEPETDRVETINSSRLKPRLSSLPNSAKSSTSTPSANVSTLRSLDSRINS